jgi:hypothetical protein
MKKTFLTSEQVAVVKGYLSASSEEVKPIFNEAFVKAQKHAEYIVTLAKEATGKDFVGKEADSISELAKEVKELLAAAPKGKEGKEALEAIQGDVVLVESFLAEVSTLINNGDYLTAVDKVKAAGEKAASLKTELEEAIAKKKGRK